MKTHMSRVLTGITLMAARPPTLSESLLPWICFERLRQPNNHLQLGYIQDGCKKVPQAISDVNTTG